MKFSYIFLTCLLIPAFVGCATVQTELIEPYILTLEEPEDIIVPVTVPDIAFFVSAPFEEKTESALISQPLIPVPVEPVPAEPVPAEPVPVEPVPVEPVPVEPVPVEPVPVEPVLVGEIVAPVVVPVGNNPDDTVAPVEEPNTHITGAQESDTSVEKDISENNAGNIVESTKTLPLKTPELVTHQIETDPDVELRIVLHKEGWIYNGDNRSADIKLIDRTFDNGSTIFLFSFPNVGQYELSFSLQDFSTGLENKLSYEVSVEDEEEYIGPVIIEAFDDELINSSESDEVQEISTALEDENIPEIIASFDQFLSSDNPINNKLFYDVFNLLENQGGYDQYLVDLAENVYSFYPYDNLSAEMLYRAALALEQPGADQDIEKALDLFKLVKEQFPISMYSDKSEERIRYLERHFMKIY